MSNLRKDGMAFIVKCPTQPLNIGVPVTLLGKHTEIDAWLCEGNVKPSPGGRPLPEEVPYKLTWVPSQYLSPIDGDSVGDKEVADLYKAPPVPTEHKETVNG